MGTPAWRSSSVAPEPDGEWRNLTVAESRIARKGDEGRRGADRGRWSIAVVRARIAQALWFGCVACALVLAGGALLIALQGAGSNEGNALYRFFVDGGDRLDFVVFARENGLFDFVGKRSDVKDALTNWGIAAIVWLVIGRVLERLLRP